MSSVPSQIFYRKNICYVVYRQKEEPSIWMALLFWYGISLRGIERIKCSSPADCCPIPARRDRNLSKSILLSSPSGGCGLKRIFSGQRHPIPASAIRGSAASVGSSADSGRRKYIPLQGRMFRALPDNGQAHSPASRLACVH